MATSARVPRHSDLNQTVARRFADLLLLSVTSVELALLIYLTPAFTLVDWIYISQHLLVLGIAVTRRPPAAQDHSLPTSAAVVVSYSYPYAQMAWLAWMPGEPAWPGARTCHRDDRSILESREPSRAGAIVRRPSCVAESRDERPVLDWCAIRCIWRTFLSDIGYNLQEWNLGSVLHHAGGVGIVDLPDSCRGASALSRCPLGGLRRVVHPTGCFPACGDVRKAQSLVRQPAGFASSPRRLDEGCDAKRVLPR